MSKFDKLDTNEIIERTLLREEGINEKLEMIAIDSITANPYQPRKIFNKNDIKELSQSIERVGLLQPIVVKKEDKEKYSLIMGERRLRACKLLRHNSIKAIVIKQDSFDNIVTALAENTHRTNLKPIEEALALQKILDIKKCSKKELAKIVSKSYDHTVSLLSIVNLPKEVQDELLEDNSISISIQTLQALSRLDNDKKIISLFKDITKKALNKKESLSLINQAKAESVEQKEKYKKDKDFVSDTNFINQTGAKAESETELVEQNNNRDFVSDTNFINQTGAKAESVEQKEKYKKNNKDNSFYEFYEVEKNKNLLKIRIELELTSKNIELLEKTEELLKKHKINKK